jgi:succinoglycan biosynthesis protein ExoA
MEEYPIITIAMPVRNEGRFIKETLIQILGQDYPSDRFEVIVADGMSEDNTRQIVLEIIKNYPNVKLIENPGRLPSSGRNVGFRNGKGDIFLVIDGHCRIPTNYLLKDVANCFEKSGAQCLGRPQPFVIPKKSNIEKAIALARSSWLGHSSNSFIHADTEGFVNPISVGCAYRREVFEKIGFLDESFDACEDVEFNYRVEKAGFRTFFSPKIAIYYYPREALSGLWRQLIRYGMGRSNFMFKHPEAMNLDMFTPAIFVLGLLLGPLFFFIHRCFIWAYVSILWIYFIIVLFESLRLSKGSRYVFTGKLISTFFVIHASLGVGILVGVWKRLLRYLLR